LTRRIGGVVRIDAGQLTVGKIDVAIVVKDTGHKVRSGVQQRDTAIKVGAKGATTIVYCGGKLVAPYVSEDVERDYPEVAAQIFSSFSLNENDVVVIGTAGDEEKAEEGAYAAIRTLLR
ncbi:TPA: DUF4443 domain-containing protein, partial [Candidatus Bathyarchaeota archaeon]|nr:DUF4443 domain-containing protein [Candidatus Bathyarchaeota archaeon]